jgi:serine/threonine-protein kinase
LQQLGVGRFGSSWLGQAEGGYAVVKLLHARPSTQDARRRFFEEASRAAQVRGRTVARLMTAGSLPDGRIFLLYEYASDQSLADVLRSQARLSPSRALDVCAEIAEGLHLGHTMGLLHRDLKAANVALWIEEDGSELVRVLDLPTCHLAVRAGLREAGPLPLSSAATVSPEEARGERVDVRADLYGVGVLLFQSLTGRLPVTGSTVQELLKSHRDHPPLSLRDAGRKLPQLEEVVARLLSKRPADRPANGLEVAEELRALAPKVEDEQNPRPARAAEAPPETPLPMQAPRLEAPAQAQVGPMGTAVLPPSPRASADAPPSALAGDAEEQTQRARKSARDVLDPDRTPPDPVLATLDELPAPPSWLPQQANEVSKRQELGTAQLPTPPAWLQEEAARTKAAAALGQDKPAPAPAAPPPQQSAAQPAPQHHATIPDRPSSLPEEPEVHPPPARGESAHPTVYGGPPPIVPPRLLRRRRGGKAAFSGPGHKATPLERQLVKLGLGLVVLLGLLVVVAMKLMSEDPAPRRRSTPQAKASSRTSPSSKPPRVAEASEE